MTALAAKIIAPAMEVTAHRIPEVAPKGRRTRTVHQHPGALMQTTQGTMLQTLRSIQAFLDEEANTLGTIVTSGTRQRLDSAIADLSTHATAQTGSSLASQGATQKQRALRQALLRDHMAPIARISNAELPQTPQVEPLRMPKGKPTAERLAQAASGMAKAATPYAAVFIEAGLPNDFITQLTDAAAAMIDSILIRSQSRGKSTGATKGLKARLADARKTVLILDAFVKSALKDNPALLRNWNSVRRVRRSTGRPLVSQTPLPAPSTSTPTLVAG